MENKINELQDKYHAISGEARENVFFDIDTWEEMSAIEKEIKKLLDNNGN